MGGAGGGDGVGGRGYTFVVKIKIGLQINWGKTPKPGKKMCGDEDLEGKELGKVGNKPRRFVPNKVA